LGIRTRLHVMQIGRVSFSIFRKLYHRFSMEIKIITTMYAIWTMDSVSGCGPPARCICEESANCHWRLVFQLLVTCRSGASCTHQTCIVWHCTSRQSHFGSKVKSYGFFWLMLPADADSAAFAHLHQTTLEMTHHLFTYFGFGVNKSTHSSQDMLMV